jgi:pullulanase
MALILGACGDGAGPGAASLFRLDAGAPSANPSDVGRARGENDGVAVTFRVTVPGDTPAEPPVHVAGDFQSWDPRRDAFRLARVQPRRWEGTFRLEPGPIAYKYARGAWGRVEKGPRGEERRDRTAIAEDGALLEDAVASWADRPARPSTITGDVRALSALDRNVLVYLPPGYEARPRRRYPVLYMLDGQNVFDARTAFAGEWAADEAAERLIAAGDLEPLIIVALENGREQRLHEYTPWADPEHDPPGGGGATHLSRIVAELVPLIDRTFRTRARAPERGICGASLGGLMAAYAGYAHPEVFGRIAAVSPSIWWRDRGLLRHVAATPKPPARIFYADMGTLEAGGLPALRALRAALVADGFVEGEDLFVEAVPGAGHDEGAWRARFPDILRRLFPL